MRYNFSFLFAFFSGQPILIFGFVAVLLTKQTDKTLCFLKKQTNKPLISFTFVINMVFYHFILLSDCLLIVSYLHFNSCFCFFSSFKKFDVGLRNWIFNVWLWIGYKQLHCYTNVYYFFVSCFIQLMYRISHNNSNKKKWKKNCIKNAISIITIALFA